MLQANLINLVLNQKKLKRLLEQLVDLVELESVD